MQSKICKYQWSKYHKHAFIYNCQVSQYITDNSGPPGECQSHRDRNKFSLQRKLYQEEERKQNRKKYTEQKTKSPLFSLKSVCVRVCVSVSMIERATGQNLIIIYLIINSNITK